MNAGRSDIVFVFAYAEAFISMIALLFAVDSIITGTFTWPAL